ncbi:MAG: Integral rane sensor signal transduction histidine kinase [Pedosphaera sp.]|nr:Integral rane sensor signal transduction histidine kinase [Pedosphaera sp.]
MPVPEPAQQASRILAVQRNIVLPTRLMVMAMVLYYLFYKRWLAEAATPREVVLETLQRFFIVYIIFNALTAVPLVLRRFPPSLVQWLIFTVGLFDGLLLAGLTLETGGFESTLFWLFPGLIIINALSIPLATPQIVLNLSLSVFYLSAGLANATISDNYTAPDIPPLKHPSKTKKLMANLSSLPEPAASDAAAEPFLLRLIILWLMTFSCYGVQLLAFRDRQAQQEAQEADARNSELKAAGRLAAEIAHQLKNPLGIINNAIYSLQRGLKEGKKDVSQQIEIIREEIERSDRIITQIMGYAQLSEGRVEKLNIAEELDRALSEALPPGANYPIQILRDYGPTLPPLMMQRSHLSAILVNLLQNAREAINGSGMISVSVQSPWGNEVEIVIEDDGPGVPADKVNRIFEAYFTSKEKGTGLGLAIVKHNIELYGGAIHVESKLGKGARFIVLFPARSFIR